MATKTKRMPATAQLQNLFSQNPEMLKDIVKEALEEILEKDEDSADLTPPSGNRSTTLNVRATPKPVSTLAANQSGSRIRARKKGIEVRIPRTRYSRSALSVRRMASARSRPHTTSFATIGS